MNAAPGQSADAAPGGNGAEGPQAGTGAGDVAGPGPAPGRDGGAGAPATDMSADGQVAVGGLSGHPPGNDEGGPVPLSGSGQDAEEREAFPSGQAAPGVDSLSVRTPRSLFAEPGAAPPAVLQDLSPQAEPDPPSGPAMPPRQRLPAWIASLLQ
jgi:hypothetical protein